MSDLISLFAYSTHVPLLGNISCSPGIKTIPNPSHTVTITTNAHPQFQAVPRFSADKQPIKCALFQEDGCFLVPPTFILAQRAQ